jgi:hypothetical protein
MLSTSCTKQNDENFDPPDTSLFQYDSGGKNNAYRVLLGNSHGKKLFGLNTDMGN